MKLKLKSCVGNKPKSCVENRGRKSEGRTRINILLSDEAINHIDSNRGGISRGKYIEQCLGIHTLAAKSLTLKKPKAKFKSKPKQEDAYMINGNTMEDIARMLG